MDGWGWGEESRAPFAVLKSCNKLVFILLAGLGRVDCSERFQRGFSILCFSEYQEQQKALDKQLQDSEGVRSQKNRSKT